MTNLRGARQSQVFNICAVSDREHRILRTGRPLHSTVAVGHHLHAAVLLDGKRLRQVSRCEARAPDDQAAVDARVVAQHDVVAADFCKSG